MQPVLHGRRAALGIDETAVHELALVAKLAERHSRDESSRHTKENQLSGHRYAAPRGEL